VATDADLAKRKAAEVAALKLGPGGSTPENNLEQHVRRFRVFDLNQIVVIGASQKQLIKCPRRFPPPWSVEEQREVERIGAAVVT
jgi:hypothetical protein